MVKVILKNTFISYEQDEDEDSDDAEGVAPLPCPRKASSPRSRSADGRCSSPVVTHREPEDSLPASSQIEKLNILISPLLSTTSSPRLGPSSGPSGRCSPHGEELLTRLFSPLPSGASSPKMMPTGSSCSNFELEHQSVEHLSKDPLSRAPNVQIGRAAFERAAGAALAASSGSGGSADALPTLPADSTGRSRGQQMHSRQRQQQHFHRQWEQFHHGGSGGPSAQELKQLQRRLEEVCHSSRRPRADSDSTAPTASTAAASFGGQGSGRIPRVTSNGSVSTMAPAEDEDSDEKALQRGMPVEFDLTIEEDPPLWSSQVPSGGFSSRAPMRQQQLHEGEHRHSASSSSGAQRLPRRQQQPQQQTQQQRKSHSGQNSPSPQGSSPPSSPVFRAQGPTGSAPPRKGSGAYSPPGSPTLGHSASPYSESSHAGSARFFDRSQDVSSEYKPPQRRPKEYRHAHVPKNVNLREEYKQPGRDSAPTTIMIRNIPNHYTQRQLINELDSLGFGGTFDFLYIPLDKGTMSNVGYAFVNFVESGWAERCMTAFQNHRFKPHRKIAAVSVAHIQGLEANLAHYENAAVNTAKLKQRRPVIMANISQSLSSALLDE